MNQLANFITYAAAHMTMRRGEIKLAIGSGFVYRKNNKHYLVTAWHNLAGRNTETLKPLDSKNGAFPDNIVVDLGFMHDTDVGISYFRMSVILPLYKDEKALYLVHEQGWPRVDVAVMPIDLEQEYNFEAHLSDGTTRKYSQMLQYRQADNSLIALPFLTRDLDADLVRGTAFEIEHTIGDDLFLIGFPAGITDHLVNPIWKRASFASSIRHNWAGEKLFIVDSASRKGMSGCVALYYSKTGVVPVGPGSSLKISTPICILHGVYAGRYGDSEFEAQVGRVWKMDIVDEIITASKFASIQDEVELPISVIRNLINSEWPKRASAAEEYLTGNPSIFYFRHFIMEKIDGMADVNLVKDLIIEIARERNKISAEHN